MEKKKKKKKIKIIPIVIIIILVAVLSCEAVQFFKKDTKEIKSKTDTTVVYKNSPETSNEKTIDLHGTYSQNDLKVTEVPTKIDGLNKEVDVIQISGLKNKKIENQINNEILSTLKDFVAKDPKGIDNYYYTSLEANFANVLSVKISHYADSEDGGFGHYIGLNYNLTNGEKIKFADLFKKNEDLAPIVRQIIYKASLLYNHEHLDAIEGDPGFADDAYYDADKKAWYATYTWYDEKTQTHKEEKREYVLAIDETDIEKYTKKYLNSENPEFFFSPSTLSILYNNEEFTIYMAEIADKVVIYDKYLTENSIFEKDDIGANSVITCSFETIFGKLKEAKYESNNFFYDMSFWQRYEDDYPNKDYAKQKDDEAINIMKERVNEYKELASKNPDKAYFLFLEAENTAGINRKIRNTDNDAQTISFETEYNSLFILNLNEKIIVCDINERDKALEQILDCYRYYNLNFYGSIYNFLSDGDDPEQMSSKNIDYKYTEKNSTKYYDCITKEEYKSGKDIFKDYEHYTYINVLKNQTNDRIIFDEKTTFDLYSEYFKIKDKNDNSEVLNYSGFRVFLKLKTLNTDGTPKEDSENENSNTMNNVDASNIYSNEMSNTDISNTSASTNSTTSNEASDFANSEILPSSTRKIEESEIRNMTKDELYLAYNEIFARHGHDFKTKKFKDYFSTKDWYHPIEGKSVSLSELNEIEVYNANLLKTAADEK